MQANGRDQKVSDELCANLTRPDNGRECVRIDSSSCNTVWEVERWEEVSGKEGGRWGGERSSVMERLEDLGEGRKEQ